MLAALAARGRGDLRASDGTGILRPGQPERAAGDAVEGAEGFAAPATAP
jgi:hypothetical protein